MKHSDYGRRPQKAPKAKSQKELDAARRLDQVIDRLRASLGLGWRAQDKGIHRGEQPVQWECADISVQAQAARALLGYVECFVAQHQAVEKDQAWQKKLEASLVEATAALRTLLSSPSSAVRCQAASTSSLLSSHLRNHWSHLAAYQLVDSLAVLLDDADCKAVCSAAKALQELLRKLPYRANTRMPFAAVEGNKQEISMWHALAKANPLARIEQQLVMCQQETAQKSITGVGLHRQRAAAELMALASLVERWPSAQQALQGSARWCYLVSHFFGNEDASVAAAAFACGAAMGTSPPSGNVFVHDCKDMWRYLIHRLQSDQNIGVREQALRLLAQLPKASKFLASIGNKELEALVCGTIQVLISSLELKGCQPAIPSSSPQAVKFEALRAVIALLRWPGQHHKTFFQSELLKVLSELLGGRGEKDENQVRRDPKVRLLAWQTLFWYGAFSPGCQGNDVWKQRMPHREFFAKLSEAFLQVVHRRSPSVNPTITCTPEEALKLPALTFLPTSTEDQATTSLLPPGYNASPQEEVEICRATLAFMTSKNPVLASSTREALEAGLGTHGTDWLPSLVRQVAAYRDVGKKTTPADDQTRVSRLTAIGVLANVTSCIDKFLEAGAFAVLLRSIQHRTTLLTYQRSALNDSAHEVAVPDSYQLPLPGPSPPLPSSGSGSLHSGHSVEYFSGAVDLWEGADPVLYAALSAFAEVLRGLKPYIAGSLVTTEPSKRNLNRSSVHNYPCQPVAFSKGSKHHFKTEDEEVFSHLVGEEFAPGVQWLASQVRAIGFGTVGFPSAVGKSMSASLDDPSTADVEFLFPSGQKLHVHRAVLAARSPRLLSLFSSKVANTPDPSHPRPHSTDSGRLAGHDELGQSAYSRSNLQKDGNPSAAHSHLRDKPLKVRMSSKVRFSAFRAILEHVYAGVVLVTPNDTANVATLAGKCGVKPLGDLLQGHRTRWGQPPAVCDLSAALASPGWGLSDAVIYTDRSASARAGSLSKHACGVEGPHMHAHRVVLRARCEYLDALFRSGMRDSLLGQVCIPDLSISAVGTLLHFLYSGHLRFEPIPQPCQLELPPPSGIVHSALLAPPSLEECFSIAMELSSLSVQWMMADLEAACQDFVLSNMNVETGLHVLREGATWQQWDLVQAAIQCLAPAYGQLREKGHFDGLGEDLEEAVRLAHVKLWRLACT